MSVFEDHRLALVISRDQTEISDNWIIMVYLQLVNEPNTVTYAPSLHRDGGTAGGKVRKLVG